MNYSFLFRTSLSFAKVKRAGCNVNSTSWSRLRKPSGDVKITWRVPRFPPALRSTTYARRTRKTQKRRLTGSVRINKRARWSPRTSSSMIKVVEIRINISRFGTNAFRTRQMSSMPYETAERDVNANERPKRRDTPKCFGSRKSTCTNATSRANAASSHFSRTLMDAVINKLVFVETENL